MPAPIVSGLINLMVADLGVTVWDGEVPRYDEAGTAINPDAVTSPSDWPVVKLEMLEPGFARTPTTEDPYDDVGQIEIEVWGTARAQVEQLLDLIEALWAQASNWGRVELGGPSVNPYYVISMLLASWYCGQEKGSRTSKGELLYRGYLRYDVDLHGAISSY